MASLYVIAGHNGAGKSTHSRNLLPDPARQLPIFDGDVVYGEALREAFLRLKVAKFAQREAMEVVVDVFEKKVREALASGSNFAYEGHFSQAGAWKPLQEFKEAGYGVEMVFLGLQSVELSQGRVEKRAQQGGHYVNAQAVRENYFGNLDYLNLNLSFFDRLSIYDTSQHLPRQLYVVEKGLVTHRVDQVPEWAEKGMPGLAALPLQPPTLRPTLAEAPQKSADQRAGQGKLPKKGVLKGQITL